MSGQEFIDTVTRIFGPFLNDLGFIAEGAHVSGKLYRMQYEHRQYVVSVSYEPGEDYLLIMSFTKVRGRKSDFDDRALSRPLSELAATYLPGVTSEERKNNESVFRDMIGRTEFEIRLLKAATELRLCLIKVLEEL